MNKGKVIEINSKYAILLNDNMQYEKIKAKEGLSLGSTIYYFKEDLYVKKQKHFSKIVIAAAIIFAMVFIQPQTIEPFAFGYVSVDINPSVQMEVNKDLNVIKVEAKNEDAESIIKDEWIGKNFEEVINEIIEAAQDKGILNETRNFVLISYYFEDEDEENQTEKKFEESLNNLYENSEKEFEMAVVKSDEETVEESKKNGESIGRKTIRQKINKEVSAFQMLKKILKKIEMLLYIVIIKMVYLFKVKKGKKIIILKMIKKIVKKKEILKIKAILRKKEIAKIKEIAKKKAMLKKRKILKIKGIAKIKM